MEYDDPRRMYPVNIGDATHLNALNHVTQPIHIQTNQHHATLQTTEHRVLVGGILDGSVVTLPQITATGQQFQQQLQHSLIHPAQQTHHTHIQQLQCQTPSGIAQQSIQHLQTTALQQHHLQNNGQQHIIGIQNMGADHTVNNNSDNAHLNHRLPVTSMALSSDTVIAEVVDVINMSSAMHQRDQNFIKCLLCNETFDNDKITEFFNFQEVVLTSTRRTATEVLSLVVGEEASQNLGNDLCNKCFLNLEKIDAMQQTLLNAKIEISNTCRNTLQAMKPNEEIAVIVPELERLQTQSVVEKIYLEDDAQSGIEMEDDPNDPDVTLNSLKQSRRRKGTKKKISATAKNKRLSLSKNKRKQRRPQKIPKEPDEILEGEESVSCPCCQKTVRSSIYLKHIINNHKVFPCPFCSNLFRQMDIKIHVAEDHQEEVEFPCTSWSCSEVFETFSCLKRHCKEVHCGQKTDRPNCQLCDKSFSSASALRVHLETIHDNAQAVKCPICKECFNQKGNMRNHFRRVHEGNQNKNLQCSTCGKGFVRPSELRKHVEKVHLKLKKSEAVCPVCSKVFGEERSLKVHINAVHTKEIKYPCSDCKMVFNSHTNMLTHRRRMHTGLEGRKHICGICSKGFCSPSDLRTHVKVVHENVRKYACDLCGQRFKVGSHLKYHRRRHTGEAPYKCPHCAKCFHGPSHISDHVKKVHRTVYMGVNQRRKLNLPDDAPPPPPGILPSKNSKGTLILTSDQQEPPPPAPPVAQIIIPQQAQIETQHILPFGATNMISGTAMMDSQNHYANIDQTNHAGSVPMIVRLLHDTNY